MYKIWSKQDKYKFFHFKSYYQSNLYSQSNHISHNINHILNIKCLPNHHNSDICKDNLVNSPDLVHKLNSLMDLRHMLSICSCMVDKQVNQLHNNHLDKHNLLWFYLVSMLDNYSCLLHKSSNLMSNSSILMRHPQNILVCNHIVELQAQSIMIHKLNNCYLRSDRFDISNHILKFINNLIL